MSNFENMPPLPTQPPKEVVPHSGNAGFEFPVVQGVEDISDDVIAKTEIPHTVTAGFGEPDSVEPGEKATWSQSRTAVREQYTPQPEKKSKKGLIAIGAGVASLLVAGGAIFGLNASKDDGKNETLPPEPTPTASAPVTPGAQETATPTAVVTPPAPQPTETLPQAGEVSGKAAEYDMTDAEYQKIVDSFKIDRATHPTPESALAAFNEKMTDYFNGGQTKQDVTDHLKWSSTSVPQPGWNSWANEVYTSAIEEGMFGKGYTNTEGNYIPKMKDLKLEANRMWSNTDDANQPDYKMAFNLVPKDGIKVFGNGGFIAYGDIVYTDNAADSTATATDSHAIGTYTMPNESVAMAPDDETNTWRVTRIISGMTFGK